MAYIGREPTVGNFQVCDAISVVNGQAAYTMQVSSVNVLPESANHMLVSLNGILQRPGSSFTVSGSTITFASNLVTGDSIDFIQILGDVLNIGTPSDGTVSTAKIVDANVTTAKIADANISLAKLSATGTKNSTTFLRGDNTFAEAGGVWVRTHYTQIGTDGATQIDFTGLSSSYEVYKFYFVNIRPETDDVYMKFFMNVGGSFQTGNSYGYAIRLVDSDQTLGSAAAPEDNAFARVQVNGTGNATGETLNGEITIFDPSGTTNFNVITTNFNSINTGGKSSSNVGVISNMSSAAALTGIRIKFSSGKMLAGGLIIGYGLKA